jgi:mRNA-degrading endonuclease RelE of RelBE toxin-antitoxin system
MSYEVLTTPDFKRFFKKIYKKHPSLKDDLNEIIVQLENNYELGTPLGSNLYKVRMAIESKNKGTSAGARVFYYFLSEANEIYLIHIYDKSKIDNIPKHILEKLLEDAGL